MTKTVQQVTVRAGDAVGLAVGLVHPTIILWSSCMSVCGLCVCYDSSLWWSWFNSTRDFLAKKNLNVAETSLTLWLFLDGTRSAKKQHYTMKQVFLSRCHSCHQSAAAAATPACAVTKRKKTRSSTFLSSHQTDSLCSYDELGWVGWLLF